MQIKGNLSQRLEEMNRLEDELRARYEEELQTIDDGKLHCFIMYTIKSTFFNIVYGLYEIKLN